MGERRHQPDGLSRREAGAIIAGLCALPLGACGPVRNNRIRLTRGRSPVLVPSTPRVDAVPGSPLLFPVVVEGPLPGSLAPEVALSDGRSLEASLVWIGIEQDASASASWLPAVARWVIAPVEAGAIPASAGSWHVVCDVPADAGGQALRLGDRRVPVNWLADPDGLRPASEESEDAWEPWSRPNGTPRPDPGLLAPEWRSPLRRWRARLATNGLGSPAPDSGVWSVTGDAAVLDRLAVLVERRWRVGLARLWYADGPVCRDLLRSLTRTVELAPGRHVPAWPADQSALEALLTDLLDPSLQSAALVTRADAWIRTLPRSAAWVEDDGAAIAGGAPRATLAAASLRDEPTLLWVTGEGGGRIADPEPLLPGGAMRFGVSVRDGEDVTGARAFSVYRADEVTSAVVRKTLTVRPPGARCGPLMHDWSLNAWAMNRESLGAARDPAWATGALLLRDDSGVSASGWSVYVECARSAEAPSSDDTVRLWFGPRGDSIAVLTVGRDGSLTTDTEPDGQTLLPVSELPDRWAVTVPVPENAIEERGLLRVGLSRTDGAGLRTAWPRRMMPWDDEPSRCVLDLNGWGGQSRPRAGT